MNQGKRLQYLVPGYTGHIPKKVYDDFVPVYKKQPVSHIPGYAGYVHAIKPENLHASTFGKITYSVNNDQYIKGQDTAPRHKYVSTQKDTNIPPTQMLRRTAAEIVGVPNKKITVKQPMNLTNKGELTQFEQVKTQQFKQSLQNTKNKWAYSSLIQKQGKQYVELGTPLPGYTGFGKRVIANNIFGKTFAQCRNDSLNDANKLNHDRQKNFNTQINLDPPLKF